MMVNEKVFDNREEWAAYWTGFFMADGYISYSSVHSQRIGITVSERDREHLEKLYAWLGCSTKLLVRNPYGFSGIPSVEMRFQSKHVVNALAGFGFVGTKPQRKVIGLERNRHFWRGVVDGDGDLGVYHDCTRDRYREQLRLSGHLPLMQQYEAFVRLYIAKAKLAAHGSSDLWRLTTTGGNAKLLALVLYGECTVALQRKADIATSFFV